eukprot:PhF_6_TR28313/c0_g1_i1/m.41932
MNSDHCNSYSTPLLSSGDHTRTDHDRTSTVCLEGGYMYESGNFYGYFPPDPTAEVETKGGCGTTHSLHSTSPALCLEGGYYSPLCMQLFLDGPWYFRSGPHFGSALNCPTNMKKHKLFIGQLPY